MYKLRFLVMLMRWLFWTKYRRVLTDKDYFLATPFDCDINIHVNNGNFLRFMDLGRWQYILKNRLIGHFWASGLRPMAVRVEINFRKGIPPFLRFYVQTKIKSVNEKTVIFSQVFHRAKDDAILADAEVTVVLVKNGKAQPRSSFEHFLAVRP